MGDMFDAGAAINAFTQGQQVRTNAMLLQRQISREDKQQQQQDDLHKLAAKLYAPKTPKPETTQVVQSPDALPMMQLPATDQTVGGPQTYPTSHPEHTDLTVHSEAPADFMQGADQETLNQIAQIGTPEAYSLIDHYNKQSEAGKKILSERASMLGNAALYADTPEKWDQSIDWLVQNGHPEIADYKGKFSPESRGAAIAAAGLLDKYDKRTADKYMPVSGIGLFKLPSAEGGDPQQIGQGLQPGAVHEGYRFKGGNPNDRNSWESVGGQTPASGNFPQ
jgi:hypothetical protein